MGLILEVTYSFTNRTPQMKLTSVAFGWLQEQIDSASSLLPCFGHLLIASLRACQRTSHGRRDRLAQATMHVLERCILGISTRLPPPTLRTGQVEVRDFGRIWRW